MVRGTSSADLKKNSMIHFIGYGIYMGTQWLVNIVVVRVLGYEAAGILSLAITVTSMFYVVAHFNVRTYQVSDYENRFSSGEYIGQRVINCAASMLLCVIYSLICGYSGTQLICIIAYMIFKITEAVVDVLHGILQKNYRLDYIGYSFAIRGVATFLLFFVALVVTDNIVVAVLAMGAGSLVTIFLYEIPRSAKYDTITPKFICKSIYKTSVWVFIYYFFFNLLTVMPRSILEYYHGSEALGIFGSVAAPVFIIQLSATLVLTPIVNLLTEAYASHDKERFCKVCVFSAAVLLAICLVILAAAYFAGDWFLRLLIGDSIVPYTYLLVPLVVSTFFLIYSSLASNILTVIRDIKGLILSVCLGLIPCAVTSLTLIPKNGIDGIVSAMIISFAVMAVLSFVYITFIVNKKFVRDKNDKSQLDR